MKGGEWNNDLQRQGKRVVAFEYHHILEGEERIKRSEGEPP